MRGSWPRAIDQARSEGSPSRRPTRISRLPRSARRSVASATWNTLSTGSSLRVTGGEFAAGRLPEAYYDQFIRAAQAGGMEAVCATPEYGERIAANADNEKRLMDMSADAFIDIQTRLRDLFMAGSGLPVFGVSEAELGSLGVPTVIVPGNDRVHDSRVGQKVHTMIPGSELHMLPIEDSDEPVIPFTEWSDLEPEIVGVFADFMRRHGTGRVSA